MPEPLKGGPLEGIRILAIEQMQSLPYATQLLARLGAEVVKVENTKGGDQGRGSLPAMLDPEGRSVGATFLRNNLHKQSICVDLKDPRGRDLVLELAKGFDVVAENFKAGTADRLGIGYEQMRAVKEDLVYLSISGFGSTVESPYQDWPAFAPIVEAMSGIYELKRMGDQPPLVAPAGALGDIGAAMFAVVGVLAALRQRDRSGEAQLVDIAMFDAVVAMTDIVMNFWSLGQKGGAAPALIMHGFRSSDGWFIVQAGREHQFHALLTTIGHPELIDDPRFATRQGWVEHLEEVLRPAIEQWASQKTKIEAAEALSAAGVAAGPCFTDEEVVVDPHLLARDMVVSIARTDGVEQPVLTPGNPVRISSWQPHEDGRVPWLGEDTEAVLRKELGIDSAAIAQLRDDGVIA